MLTDAFGRQRMVVEDRSQRSDVRGWKSEVQRAEVQRSEGTEVRGRRSEVRSRKNKLNNKNLREVMNKNKYLDDLKNLKPLPFNKIPRSGIKDQNSVKELKPIKSGIKNHKSKTEVITMERLNNSKTLWGFGIAVFIYILQNILIALNIAGPDNLIIKTAVEVIIAIAGFFGVYGIRDALRKMQL